MLSQASPIRVEGSGNFTCIWSSSGYPNGLPYEADLSMQFQSEDGSISGTLFESSPLSPGQQCGASVPQIASSDFPSNPQNALSLSATWTYDGQSYETAVPGTYGAADVSGNLLSISLAGGGNTLDLYGLIDFVNAETANEDISVNGYNIGYFPESSGTFAFAPEPGTMALVGIAALAFLMFARRRRTVRCLISN